MVKLELISAADIEPKEIEWLWKPYIPFGKVTMLEGDPGDGKSIFALSLLAMLTRGDPMPFGGEQHEPMNTLYQNTEDDADDTVIPRFIKMGGDRNRLFFISEKEKHLTFSDKRIGEAIRETGARIIVFDPFASYIGSEVSINLANEVRGQMNYLIDVARETKCAVIVVGHLNKGAGAKALYRALGSIDVVGSARSALLIGRSKEDPDKRIMAVQKCNLAPKGQSLEFEIADGGRVEWIRPLDITADDLVGAFSSAGSGETKQQIAERELLIMLNDGPVPQKEIETYMKSLGISMRTVELVKARLPIVCSRVNKQSIWSLAEQQVTPQQQRFDTPLA